MSEEDIDKGTPHFTAIVEALASVRIGIVCVTPENISSTWMHFEAGAICKAVNGELGRLCTYLVEGLRPQDVPPPLWQFQATSATKDETLKLLKAINKALERPLEEKTLEKAFAATWPTLERELTTIPRAPTRPRELTEEGVTEAIEIMCELVQRDDKRMLRSIVQAIESHPGVVGLRKPAELAPGLTAMAPPDWADARAWQLIKQRASDS